VIATDLVNPDFAAFARSFGAGAPWSNAPPTSPPPSDAARRAGQPAVIHLKADIEAIAPGRTLTGLRVGGG